MQFRRHAKLLGGPWTQPWCCGHCLRMAACVRACRQASWAAALHSAEVSKHHADAQHVCGNFLPEQRSRASGLQVVCLLCVWVGFSTCELLHLPALGQITLRDLFWTVWMDRRNGFLHDSVCLNKIGHEKTSGKINWIVKWLTNRKWLFSHPHPHSPRWPPSAFQWSRSASANAEQVLYFSSHGPTPSICQSERFWRISLTDTSGHSQSERAETQLHIVMSRWE